MEANHHCRAGMCGLNDITMNSVDVRSGTSSHLVLCADSAIHNPSRIAMDVDKVTMNLHYGDIKVGRLKMDNMTIGRGSCAIQPIAFFEPAEADKGKAYVMLTRYLCQQPSLLTIRGDSDHISTIPYLQSALSVMNTTVIMPALPKGLLISSTMLLQPSAMLSLSALSRLSVPSQIHLRNPLSVTIKIVKISGAVYHNDLKITYMHQEFTEEPIVLLPNSETLAPQHIFQKLEVGPQQLWTLFSEAMHQDLDVFISAVMDVFVGDYPIKHLKYEQYHVPAHLSAPFM